MKSTKLSAPPKTARRAVAPPNRFSPLALNLALILLLGAFSLLPRVRGNLKMAASFWGATAILLVWHFILRRQLARTGRVIRYQGVVNTVHWVQPLMQGAVYVYWGMYWPEVYRFAPFILAQIVFAYAVDMLVNWSRRDTWILGFGPFPIILSTNLFLWFHDDWFFLQFLMVAVGVLGKEFIRWQKDGRSAHIFNPSALSLFIFSLGLLFTHSTGISWAEEIATTITRPDHIYLEIFLVGLVVQALFSVTLVTLSAAAALFVLGLTYTHFTGVYNFVDSNIPASVFLGLHLLVTDPATSPRKTPAKIVFGALYGAGVFGMYILLAALGAPRFYDKLLCVPALNLSVRALDRASGFLEERFRPLATFTSWGLRQVNLGAMVVWVTLFIVMMSTGFLMKGKDHPGGHVQFWKEACDSGKLNGCREWARTLLFTCSDGVGTSCLDIGTLQNQGRYVPQNRLQAGLNFGRACDLGISVGCDSLAQYMRSGGQQIFQRACDGGDGVSCFILGWSLTDSSTGFIADPVRALSLLRKSCADGWPRGCGLLAECYRSGKGTRQDIGLAIVNYEKACKGGHAPSCVGVAMLYRHGVGGPPDEERAKQRLRDACRLGMVRACLSGQAPAEQPSYNGESAGRG
jgi:hypothetical protein